MAGRQVFDPLEPSSEPRWYTVRNMHGALLGARPLHLSSDLKRTMVAAMLAWIDAGYRIRQPASAAGTSVFLIALGPHGSDGQLSAKSCRTAGQYGFSEGAIRRQRLGVKNLGTWVNARQIIVCSTLAWLASKYRKTRCPTNRWHWVLNNN